MLLLGRDQQALRSAATECGPAARWLALDITDPDAGERATAACLEHFGRIDVLVNNAGTTAVRSIEELTDEEWQASGRSRDGADAADARVLPGDGRAGLGEGRQRQLVVGQATRPTQHGLRGRPRRPSCRSRAPSRTCTPGTACSSTRSRQARSPASCGWSGRAGRPDCEAQGTRRKRCSTPPRRGAADRGGWQRAGDRGVIVFLCSEAASNVSGAAWSVDGGAVPVII